MAVWVVLLSVIGLWAFSASPSFGQNVSSAFSPGADLSGALATRGQAAQDANLKETIGLIEMWRMISWLILLLAGVIGGVMWAFGQRQMVMSVIGGAVILAGLFDLVAAIQAQDAQQSLNANVPDVTSSKYVVQTHVGQDGTGNPTVVLNNDPEGAIYKPNINNAPLGQVAQTFAQNGVGVMLTVVPLVMIALGVVGVVGSLFHEGALMRLYPGFVLGSVLMFACKSLATFSITNIFPSTLPNTPQLVSIQVSDTAIGNYGGSVAPEPVLGDTTLGGYSMNQGNQPVDPTVGNGSINGGPQGGASALGTGDTHTGTLNEDNDGDPTAQKWDPDWQAGTSSGMNAGTTPFVVATPQQIAAGVQMGDWAQVVVNGQTQWMRVGDSGNTGEYGELSEKAVENFGIQHNGNSLVGNYQAQVTIYPGTKNVPSMNP
jgi:hypothetical protein